MKVAFYIFLCLSLMFLIRAVTRTFEIMGDGLTPFVLGQLTFLFMLPVVFGIISFFIGARAFKNKGKTKDYNDYTHV